MRTINVRINDGGQDMDDTEVFDWEVPQTAEIPVVRPAFAGLLTQGKGVAARRSGDGQHADGWYQTNFLEQRHAMPLPLLPAPRAVVDPEDQLVTPRSRSTRWTKDEVEQALWKTAILGLVLLSGLLVWNSDTGKSIREELSLPSVTLNPQNNYPSVVAPTQSAEGAPRVDRSLTQSAETRKTLSRPVAVSTSQSEAPSKGSDPVLPVTNDTAAPTPAQSANPTPAETQDEAAPPADPGSPEGSQPDPGIDQPNPGSGGEIPNTHPTAPIGETPPASDGETHG